VLAAATPGDCFWMALEASRIAIDHMTPVILLTDGYIANGSEPFLIPKVEDLPAPRPRYASSTNGGGFKPYLRDEATLARPWALPGTPGLEHRIGGLEKADVTGNVSYDPLNHEHMIRTRAEKVARIARDIPPLEIYGPESGDLLVVGWGGTYGAIHGAVRRAIDRKLSVAQVHLRHLNPLPKDLGDILKRYRKVLVPELNTGQLSLLLRGKYLVDAIGYNKVQGRPFGVEEILSVIQSNLEAKRS
jgi:2-oxoglutarate ferredoxin oxidoreductase subunit alpha